MTGSSGAEPRPWISRRWDEAVAAHADRTALVWEGRALSFADLDRRVTVLAEAMTTASPDPRVPVAAVLASRLDAVVAAYAGWKAGRPFSQIDPTSPTQRVQELLDLMGAAALVTEPTAAGRLRGVTVIDPAALGPAPRGVPLHVPADDEDGTLTFTSGSTGRPKGVVSPVGANATRTEALHAVYGFGPDDRVGLTLSPSFGASAFVLPVPVFGASLHLHDPARRGARGILEWAASERITLLVVVPVLLREMLELLPAGEHLPDLRIVAPMADKVLGADVLAARERLTPGVRIVGQFGATEVGPATVFDVGPDDEVPDGILPVGVPFPGVDVWIDRPDPSGAGKIVIRTPGLCRGYWGDPVLTAAMMPPDPDRPGGRLFVSGDVGRFDARGRLVFMGRRDAMAKIRGVSVDLSEIERRLTALPSVREALVSVDEPRVDRPRIVAHVVPATSGVTTSGIRRELAVWLPRAMLPGAVVVCTTFPRNDRGKVVAEELPPVPPGRPRLDTAFAGPATETERLVIRQWEAVLGVVPVGVDDDFFDLGGDSLAVVEVLDRISHAVGVPLPHRTFDVPTVRAVAARCDAARRARPPSPLVPLSSEGDGAPLVLVHGAGGLAESLRELAAAIGPARPVSALEPVGDEGVVALASVRRTAERYVAAVEQAHPSGPLLVGGLSGGGIIAMEVARLLAVRGRRPRAVVLLDTVTVDLRLPLRGAGGTVARPRAEAWARRRVAVVKREALLWGWSVPVLHRLVPSRTGFPQREHRAVAAARAGRPLDPADRREHLEALMRRGSRRWRARRYEGPVLLVRASDPAMTAGWHDVATDLTVVDVPGDHESFVRPPQVEVLAQRLEDWLADRALG